MVYSYHGVLLSNNKKGNQINDTQYHMDVQKHVERKSQGQKKTLYHIIALKLRSTKGKIQLWWQESKQWWFGGKWKTHEGNFWWNFWWKYLFHGVNMSVHNCQKFIKLNTYDHCILVCILGFQQYLEGHIINNSCESKILIWKYQDWW